MQCQNIITIKLPRVLTLVVILSCSCLPEIINAQVLNIEQFRKKEDTSNYFTGNSITSFSATKKQNTLIQVNQDLSALYFSKKHFYLAIFSLQFLSLEGEDIFNSNYLHLRSNFNRKQRISTELFFQYQNDENLFMKHRILQGGDLRFKILNTKKAGIYFASGVMLEYEEWQKPEEKKYINHFIKSTSYLSISITLNDNMDFSSTTYYQARPELFFKPRIFSDNRLTTKINKWLGFTASYHLFYDAIPIIDIKNFTYETTLGLTVEF